MFLKSVEWIEFNKYATFPLARPWRLVVNGTLEFNEIFSTRLAFIWWGCEINKIFCWIFHISFVIYRICLIKFMYFSLFTVFSSMWFSTINNFIWFLHHYNKLSLVYNLATFGFLNWDEIPYFSPSSQESDVIHELEIFSRRGKLKSSTISHILTRNELFLCVLNNFISVRYSLLRALSNFTQI